MFNWLQTRFQKHFKGLFIVVMTLVCISFVFTVGNFSGIDAGARVSTNTVDFYGYNLNSRQDAEELSRGAEIYAYLEKNRSNPNQREQLIMQRGALLWLADQLQIGDPTPEQTQAYLRSRPLFMDSEGKFNAEAFTTFIDQIENNAEFGKKDFALALVENYRIDQANQALSSPGFALASEAKNRLKERRTQWSTLVASNSIADFQPELAPTESTLEQYYQENKLRYQIPEKTQASYVVFSEQDIIPTLEKPSQEELKTFFELNRFRFEDKADNATEEEKEALQYEDVDETAIVLEYLGDRAKPMAQRQADAFITRLYDQKIAYGSAAFEQALEENNLRLQEAEAFSANNNQTSPLPARMRQQLTGLIGSRYFSDVYPTATGAIVGFRQGTLDSRIPDFAEIKEALTADWTQAEKARLFAEQNENIQKQLTEALSAGKEFSPAAEELGLVVEEFASFTEQELPTGLPYSLLDTLKKTPNQKLSNLVRLDKKAYWVYPTEKNVPEIAEDDSELTSTLAQMKAMNQQFGNYIMVNELIRAGFAPTEDEDADQPQS